MGNQSILVSNNSDSFINIVVYYTFKDFYNNKKIIILEDEEAKKMLKDDSAKQDVFTLNTSWEPLSWTTRNQLLKDTSRVDESGHLSVDNIRYREAVVKKCLKEWDYVENSKKIPLTEDVIGRVNADIIECAFRKYEEFNYFSGEVRGN